MILKVTTLRIRMVSTRMDSSNMRKIIIKAGRPNMFVSG